MTLPDELEGDTIRLDLIFTARTFPCTKYLIILHAKLIKWLEFSLGRRF